MYKYFFFIFSLANGLIIPFCSKSEIPKKNNNLYGIKRKTVLDLGDSFRNVTHHYDHDVTFVKRNSSSNGTLGPVLVIPGLDMAGLSMYSNFIRASEERDIFIVLAGYSKEQRFETLCDCVVDFIISEGMKDVVLVGESFGAVVAIYVENRLHKCLSSLIMINPATSFHRTSWKKVILKMKRGNRQLSHEIIKHGPHSSRIIKSVVKFSESHPEYIYEYMMSYLMMLHNIIVTDQNKVFVRIESYLHMKQPELDELCKKIRIPTTIIIGKKDKLLPSSNEADRLSKIIKNAEVVKVKDANHMMTSIDFDIRDWI